LKLKYAPPLGNSGATLRVVDHWTPWTDFAIAGQRRPSSLRLAGVSAASEALMKPVGGGINIALRNARLQATINDQGQPTVLVFRQIAQGAWADQDFGSWLRRRSSDAAGPFSKTV
jgi:hypothetical protein